MTEGLPAADPRDDDEIEAAPDEHDDTSAEEGTGPDVKNDPVETEDTPAEVEEEK